MKIPLYPEELLANKNMFAGKIMQQLTHDSLKEAMDELFGAIEMRGGALKKPFVLLCKTEMSKALSSIYPELKVVTTDEMVESIDHDPEIVCVVTDEEKFPNHYIVLSDAKEIGGYLNGRVSLPQSALIAVKGFSVKKNITVPYSAKEFEEIVWDIVSRVAELEFAEREHDTLKSVTIYSDFMLMTMTHLGIVKNRVFLDFAPVKVEHNAQNKSRITLNFKNGTSVTMMTDEEYSEHSASDMRSTVLDGLFGR